MNTVYIDSHSKVQVLASFFNSYYNLPSCLLFVADKSTFKSTLPTRKKPSCQCTAEYRDPACSWFSESLLVEAGSGTYAGKSAIVLTEEFINQHLSEEDKAFLFESYPDDWFAPQQISADQGQ